MTDRYVKSVQKETVDVFKTIDNLLEEFKQKLAWKVQQVEKLENKV